MNINALLVDRVVNMTDAEGVDVAVRSAILHEPGQQAIQVVKCAVWCAAPGWSGSVGAAARLEHLREAKVVTSSASQRVVNGSLSTLASR